MRQIYFYREEEGLYHTDFTYVFQILNVCDYPYNVDCKGAATPKPSKPTQPPTQPSQTPTQPSQPSPTNPPQPPTRPPQPPTRPSQPPTRPSQPPTRPSQPPTRPPQPPTYPSQPPVYPPQPPTNPPQPPIYPQPYPPPPPSYPGNPWLNKAETDPWHQRPQASQLAINKEKHEQEAISADNQLLLLGNRPTPISETELVNPWTLFQVIPSELANTTCNNGDVHRLNDACTNVVVCRNNKPQMVRCSTGFSYDKPSDSCRPLSIAKWYDLFFLMYIKVFYISNFSYISKDDVYKTLYKYDYLKQ